MGRNRYLSNYKYIITKLITAVKEKTRKLHNQGLLTYRRWGGDSEKISFRNYIYWS